LPFLHQTVLVAEAVSLLRPGAGKVIVDGTLGGGGHAEALLEKGAAVIGVDRDSSAIEAAKQRLARFAGRFQAIQGNFAQLEPILREERGLPVDGLLLDLGVSSPQLDDPSRGFSFQADGPLDMRMEREGSTAAQLIATIEERVLADLLWRYGEERFALRIAKSLKRSLPATTAEAVEAVKKSVPRRAWPAKTHVATKTFQALRIAVNRELEAIDAVLEALPRLLCVGGVAAVIAFHSLEDRKVKQTFRDLEGRCTCPPGLPVCACGAKGSFSVLTRKAITASHLEVKQNPRARSARLRAVERVR